MFALIVGGPIDPVAAGFALVATAAMLTIIITSFIVKRRSREEIKNDFELAKIRLHNDEENQKRNAQFQHEVNLAGLASKREIEFKRIDNGMIEGTTAVNS